MPTISQRLDALETSGPDVIVWPVLSHGGELRWARAGTELIRRDDETESSFVERVKDQARRLGLLAAVFTDDPQFKIARLEA